jgi:hypothetical protein
MKNRILFLSQTPEGRKITLGFHNAQKALLSKNEAGKPKKHLNN